MVAVRLPNGMQQFLGHEFDPQGNLVMTPLAGGFVYMYQPNSSVPKDTWLDAAQSAANTNPIRLDPDGRAVIYGTGSYRQVVTDASGNEVWDQPTDDLGITNIQSEIDTINAQITSIVGSIGAHKTLFPIFNGPSGVSYPAGVIDDATLFTSQNAGGHLTITLPDITTIPQGWYCAGMRFLQDLSFQVLGNHGEVIFFPPGQERTSVTLAPHDVENLCLNFDGGNFEILFATPATWSALGAGPSLPSVPTAQLLGGAAGSFTTVAVGSGLMLASGVLSASTALGAPASAGVGSSGAYTIPSSVLEVIAIGGGAGGNSNGGGGSGAGAYARLTGLTVGLTLTLTVGAGGAPGAAGGDTVVASGTQTIASFTAGGGQTAPGLAIGGAPGIVSGAAGFDYPGGAGDPVFYGGSGGSSFGSGGKLGLLGAFGAGGLGSPLGGPGGNNGVSGVVWFRWIA